MRKMQPITIGQHFFNIPCPIATIATWQTTATTNHYKEVLVAKQQKRNLERTAVILAKDEG